MARHTTTAAPTTRSKPGLLSRLAGNKKTTNARVTESTSTNPITGSTTTTRKTTTHPNGLGHHGHAGKGPLGGTKGVNTRGSGAHGPATTSRNKGMATSTRSSKPSMMSKLKSSLTGTPSGTTTRTSGTRTRI